MSADRAGYIAGLRALADALEQQPDLPLPDAPGPREGQSHVAWYLFGSGAGLGYEQQKVQAAAIVRALPGRFDKVENDTLFRFRGKLGALPIEVIVDRPAVCERVVTGTREVVREVPDPEALAAVPTTTVTETVEDVRWECRPLLAPADEPTAVTA